MANVEPGGAVQLDLRLVEGFRFECRPDCGLCCYASPVLGEGELTSLLEIAPSFRPVGSRSDQVPSRPEGGACIFLRQLRCTVHAARPGPCAEFPLSAHLGYRLQVSVVLSCPGVALSGLNDRAPTVGRLGASFDPSLTTEMAAVTRAAALVTERDRLRSERDWERALRVRSAPGARRGPFLASLLDELRGSPPMPGADDLAAVPIPEESEGLERLPMFFDPQFGRVALAAGRN